MSARQRYEERRQKRGGSALSAVGIASLLLLGLFVALAGGLDYASAIIPVACVWVGSLVYRRLVR